MMYVDREVMWRRVIDDLGFERFELRHGPAGTYLHGHTMIAEKGRPLQVDYRIVADAQWRTRSVTVEQRYLGQYRLLELEHDGCGVWLLNKTSAPMLDGCLDVDLGITPSTNMLPIRRLSMAVGATQTITAAWVRFPALDAVAAVQSYERLETSRYRYRSVASGFTALVDVDAEGLPIEYQGVWTRVAEGKPSEPVPAVAGLKPNGFADALLAERPSPSLGTATDDLDWLVGGWTADVTDFGADGIRVESRGEWWFAWVLEGRALQDVWISPPRQERQLVKTAGRPDRYGSTIRWFDASAKLWRAVWINPVSGAFDALAGRREGDRMVLSGEESGQAIRWSFNDISENGFRWVGEELALDGRWRKSAEFRLKRMCAGSEV